MTYLGYQVRDLDFCEEEIKSWLLANEEECLQISTKTPVSYGWNQSNKGDLSEIEELDLEECKCFSLDAFSCNFTTESTAYKIAIVEEPQDKFGNSATYEEPPNCLWLNFQDDSGNYPNEKLEDFEVESKGSVYELRENLDDFIDWIENLANSDPLLASVGMIHEETVCNGTSCSWHYTTIKSQEDLKALFEYWINEI